MSVPSTIGQVLSDHVTLEVERIDRLYLNVFQAELQTERAVYHFLRQQRGQRAVSSRCFAAMTHRFVRDIEAFAQQHGLTIRVFQKGKRKDDVAAGRSLLPPRPLPAAAKG